MEQYFDRANEPKEPEVFSPEASMQPSICGPDYARIAAEIISLKRTTVANVFAIGAKLNKTKNDKERMPHGTFVEWITKDCQLDMRTAQKHMRVDEVLAKKSEFVTHLQPSTLYALTAKSVFDKVGSGLIARIENGEALDDNAIKDALKNARDAAQKAKQLQDGSQETPTDDVPGTERPLGASENEAQPIGDEDAGKKAAQLIARRLPRGELAEFIQLSKAADPRFIMEQLASMCAGNSPAQEEGP